MAAAIAYVERTRGRLRVCCLSWIDSLAQHPRLRGGHTVLLRVVANVAAVAGAAFGMASHAAEHVDGLLSVIGAIHRSEAAAILILSEAFFLGKAPSGYGPGLRSPRLLRTYRPTLSFQQELPLAETTSAE